MSKGLFITGTGTDVGKTFVTGLLLKKLRESGYAAGYYKAAASGEEQRDGEWIPVDADYVKRVANLPDEYDDLVSYRYKTAVSPHLASKIEGNPATLSKVVADYRKMAQKYDLVTMEGSGGIICPIRWDDDEKLLLVDLIRALKLPILIVADSGLGCINNTVLTVQYAQSRRIPIAGIIMNNFHPGDRMEEDNKYMIEQLTGVPVVATVQESDTELNLDAETLEKFYQ